ncbi:MAG: lysophospholipid acyltransferase family protein [Sphaerochaeta sp.]|jgi:1-acyl-sn-glycerol-3-phosphate acyltransferase
MKYIHFFFAFLIFTVEAIFTYVFCFFPAFILRIFGAKEKSVRLYKKYAHGLTKSALFLLGAKVHVTGKENLPADYHNVAFVSNHQSLLDIVTYYAALNISPVPIAKKEVVHMPFVRHFVFGLNSILIDRKSPKSSIKAIHDATERLKQGEECIIFPEGTRSKNYQIGELKAGSYKMALRANSTLIPLVINGSRKALEDKQGWHRYNVYVKVLKPVELKDLDKDQKKEVAETVSQRIREAYTELPALTAKHR